MLPEVQSRTNNNFKNGAQTSPQNVLISTNPKNPPKKQNRNEKFPHHRPKEGTCCQDQEFDEI